MTTKQAAKRLGVSKSRVTELCRTGKMEFDFVQIGKGHRFDIPERAVVERLNRIGKRLGP